MKIEHLALNVPDPLAMARWYVDHMGLTVKRRYLEAPWGHFLADDGGAVMLELYGNDKAPMLDLPQVAPPALHLAFASRDVEGDVKRLVSAGATLVSGPELAANGDGLAMLRDPWSVCIQLVKRAEAMI